MPTGLETTRAGKLTCPIRGELRASERAKDGLTFTEEKRRIDCIRFLLRKKYPKSYLRVETTLLKFGHKGRSSFRTDLVVYDRPVSDIGGISFDTQKEHILLIAEIKRDHKSAADAKTLQVKPAMAFLPSADSLGIYWDDVEQRLFHFSQEGTIRRIYEAPLSTLPTWGSRFESPLLVHGDLQPAQRLTALFIKIEDSLHSHAVDKTKRFHALLQLLLAKLYDEATHAGKSTALEIQDFSVLPLPDSEVLQRMNGVLRNAVRFYGKYLPEKVPDHFSLNAASLRGATKLLAPVNILSSRREVIQEFYMYFAKSLYKWDLAQYFTPTEVVDCVVEVVNPAAGEHVKDPACGSADFLISAFRWAAARDWDAADTIWGADNSSQAVQVSILNMVLNGDGKSNIQLEDSLANVERDASKFGVVVCNPPFGVKIKETRAEVLRLFDLGHAWRQSAHGWSRTDEVLPEQETGLLFAELCLRQVAPGGRVGIILPNGYLGNRSSRYITFRHWLLSNARVAAVISLPRFTFKKSGADVSASLLFFERREKALRNPIQTKEYRFHVGMVTAVGWSVGDKRAERLFKRDPETGSFVMDENNEPIPDADFASALQDLLSSGVAKYFRWIDVGRRTRVGDGWSVSIRTVTAPDVMLDPKRMNRKFVELRRTLARKDHFTVGDVVEIIPEGSARREPGGRYRYVELGDISEGGYAWSLLRGWQLPSRARHAAEAGDIFAGKIWGSVGKWFMAGGRVDDLLVTNGCYRLRLREGREKLLPDLLMGMCSEAYRVQMRGLATGSDGLAEISETDLQTVMLPRLRTKEARRLAEQYARLFRDGQGTLRNAVKELEKTGTETFPAVPERKSVFVQV